MTKKTPYDVLIGESYKNAEGQDKTNWHRAGVCFELDEGGYSGQILEGLALTGRFVIKKRTTKNGG